MSSPNPKAGSAAISYCLNNLCIGNLALSMGTGAVDAITQVYSTKHNRHRVLQVLCQESYTSACCTRLDCVLLYVVGVMLGEGRGGGGLVGEGVPTSPPPSHS